MPHPAGDRNRDDVPNPVPAGVALAAPLRRLLEQRDTEVAAIVQLLETQLVELQREVAHLKAAREQDLQDEVERLEAENAELRAERDRAREEEVVRLRAELRQRAGEPAVGHGALAVGGRPRELTPAYLAAAYVEIDTAMDEADRSMVLGDEVQAARHLFDAGYRGCEVLWRLGKDEGFYAELQALHDQAVGNLKAAQAEIDSDQKFERFVQRMVELLQLSGLDEWRAKEFLTASRLDFQGQKDRRPLKPATFRAHLLRFRDASCDIAKGNLADNLKRLERRAQYQSTAVAIGASTIKVLATTAGAALGGPVGGAVATVIADGAVAVAVPRLERTPARR